MATGRVAWVPTNRAACPIARERMGLQCVDHAINTFSGGVAHSQPRRDRRVLGRNGTNPGHREPRWAARQCSRPEYARHWRERRPGSHMRCSRHSSVLLGAQRRRRTGYRRCGRHDGDSAATTLSESRPGADQRRGIPNMRSVGGRPRLLLGARKLRRARSRLLEYYGSDHSNAGGKWKHSFHRGERRTGFAGASVRARVGCTCALLGTDRRILPRLHQHAVHCDAAGSRHDRAVPERRAE